MRNLTLFLTLTVSSFIYSQSCELELSQLIEIYDYDDSEFEIFALENGFEYDTHAGLYQCGDYLNWYGLMPSGDTKAVGYAHTDVQIYLRMKKEVNKEFDVVDSHDDEDGKSQLYKHRSDDIAVLMTTETDEELGRNFYRIVIVNTPTE